MKADLPCAVAPVSRLSGTNVVKTYRRTHTGLALCKTLSSLASCMGAGHSPTCDCIDCTAGTRTGPVDVSETRIPISQGSQRVEHDIRLRDWLHEQAYKRLHVVLHPLDASLTPEAPLTHGESGARSLLLCWNTKPCRAATSYCQVLPTGQEGDGTPVVVWCPTGDTEQPARGLSTVSYQLMPLDGAVRGLPHTLQRAQLPGGWAYLLTIILLKAGSGWHRVQDARLRDCLH